MVAMGACSASAARSVAKARNNRVMKKRFVAIILTMLGVAFAQTELQPRPDSVLERARRGDDSALSEMEKSGDIADLKTLLHDPDYADHGYTRLPLAKLGDREALQYFACRGLDDASVQDMDRIGGEFEIEVYRHLLDSDEAFLANIPKKDKDSDALITLPSSTVLFLLPKLLPNAKIPSPARLDVQAGKDGEFKSRWRAWIDSHESELRQLKPTAEGINFDQHFCSDVYDPTAMNRRLQAIGGQGAIDCNRAPNGGSLSGISSCIKASFARKRAFYVRQDLGGVDSGVAVGLAGDDRGNVFAVAYDDAGVSTTALGDKAELFDNNHTVVVPCPKPIHFRPSQSWNGLTCVANPGNDLLSPRG
jgi:hypothetical protein